MNLKSKYDDKKDAKGSEKDAGLFDGSAVSEERDDEDESSKSYENVGCLVYDCWLHKILHDKKIRCSI